MPRQLCTEVVDHRCYITETPLYSSQTGKVAFDIVCIGQRMRKSLLMRHINLRQIYNISIKINRSNWSNMSISHGMEEFQ
jgi:hypothetical protein